MAFGGWRKEASPTEQSVGDRLLANRYSVEPLNPPTLLSIVYIGVLWVYGRLGELIRQLNVKLDDDQSLLGSLVVRLCLMGELCDECNPHH